MFLNDLVFLNHPVKNFNKIFATPPEEGNLSGLLIYFPVFDGFSGQKLKLYRKILAQIAMKILFEKKIVMESWKKLQKKAARLCEQLYKIISFWQDGYTLYHIL